MRVSDTDLRPLPSGVEARAEFSSDRPDHAEATESRPADRKTLIRSPIEVSGMTERAWQDLIVGDRMAVDQEFAQQVTDSQFSRQEWGLIMTAVEFEIENPGDAEQARIVADTSKIEQVMPELENIRNQMNSMAGGAGGGGGGGKQGGGVFDSVKDALGLGGGGGGGADQDRIDDASRLAQQYADELQQRLESQGKWARVREAAEN